MWSPRDGISALTVLEETTMTAFPIREEMPRIVVGVDASKESEEALRWAAGYADFVGARLDVVHVWRLADELAWLEPLPPPARPTDAAHDALAKIVRDVLGSNPSVEATASIIEGHAAKELCDRARGALLLVVGCRGIGGFDGLLLGSVSAACAAHAPCSVMVVRPA
jgi:nucleotide-binding universal stress UspA family protein